MVKKIFSTQFTSMAIINVFAVSANSLKLTLFSLLLSHLCEDFFSLRLLKTAQVIKRGNSSHHNLPWNTRTMCQIVRIFDASFGFATSSSNFIVSGSSPTTSGISIVFLATAIYRERESKMYYNNWGNI